LGRHIRRRASRALGGRVGGPDAQRLGMGQGKIRTARPRDEIPWG
jgi:hypothetical protein